MIGTGATLATILEEVPIIPGWSNLATTFVGSSSGLESLAFLELAEEVQPFLFWANLCLIVLKSSGLVPTTGQSIKSKKR